MGSPMTRSAFKGGGNVDRDEEDCNHHAPADSSVEDGGYHAPGYHEGERANDMQNQDGDLNVGQCSAGGSIDEDSNEDEAPEQ
ncbi:MAG: hypothetical protein L6R38_005910 [Xanthoria sp. 2 TBL-2021]|nr:MAG: hypothetical protein L6R38_005910 [Xanthoria sp. 2 TBL-2021]